MAAFDDTLARYAGWLGYPRGERAQAWLARLEVKRLELVAPCSR